MWHWPEVYRKIRDAGKLIQLYCGSGLDTLDVVADQLGSAKGIILVGEAGPKEEDQVLKLIKKYGAANV
jgi:succinyl-CoA synthetase alpha subunit